MTAASSHVNLRRPEARRRHRPFRATALVALAGALVFAAQAALAQAATRLTRVELQPQPGSQFEIKLVLDGPAPQPVAFTIDNPARLAIDLPGTSVALESRRIDVKSGGIDTIVAAEASGRTRVVFNLDSLQPYTTRTEGNNVFVSIGSGVAAAANAAAPVAAATTGASSAVSGTYSIDKVDFRRGTDGAARIMVRTNDPRVQASLKQEGGRLVVDFPRTGVAPEAARRYDVTDFATPVSSFDVTHHAERRAYRRSRDRRLRTARLPERPRLRARAAPAGQDRGGGRPGQEGIPRRAPDAQLPGHRDPRRAAAAGRNQRPEHRGQRHGAGQRHAAPAERAVGPGARHRHAHQGPRQAAGRQRHLRRAGRGTRGAREADARVAEVDDRAGAGAHRVPAGQLRQGVRPRRPDPRRRARATRCCPTAAASRSTSAPTPCCCRTRPTAWPTSAGWCRPSTSRSSRC